MLGFGRRLPLPVLDNVLHKHHDPIPAEDDQRLLLFLPVLAPSLLPPEFCYRPPHANHQPPAHAAYDPTMLCTSLVFLRRRGRRASEASKGSLLSHALMPAVVVFFLVAAYYGARGHLNAAVEQAARLVALSGLRESLVEDLELSETETEVGVALEEGAGLGLTHGYLVRAQVLTKQAPKFTGDQTRWKTCGQSWQFHSGSNGLGWIFVSFIAV
ncbi:hypothetical protein BCR35DRAFT_302819 [Leucosporidium creatinivorum]|uniref:Uncharacterized protein n=1 Tax=Leucosporidium creatinivorum TaxID=106004 RepID=A0A1Y2FP19_9BASI|nr:hypothetical protein BCR35DRAFT_302819 [Leucosporidium creatinivorum]